MVNLKDVLNEFANRAIDASPMPLESYKGFIDEFNGIRKKFGLLIRNKDNTGVNRPLMSPKVFNDRCERIPFDLRVSQHDEFFSFYFIGDDNVTQ